MRSAGFLLVSLLGFLLLTVSFAYPRKDKVNVKEVQDLLPLNNLLSFGYYKRSCPEFESVVQRKVKEWTRKNYYLGPALLRLVFHDCSVTGCDGSVLLDYQGTERRSPASRTLKGFEVIDDIKAELEKKCPGKVSCADILTASARDATVDLGGPYWPVAYGRKDTNVSYAKDAEGVPTGHRDVTAMLEIFQSYGLNILDLVVLSGAHTIGRATCGTIQSRLYNYNSSSGGDPSMDKAYIQRLRNRCKESSQYVYLDEITPVAFDNQYYKNLKNHMGVLSTDQNLYSDSRTAPLVTAFSEQPSEIFRHQFGVSMSKLTNIGVLTDEDGRELVRKVCSKSEYYSPTATRY